MGDQGRTRVLTRVAIAGIAVIAAILVIGTWLTGQSAEEATRSAVKSISSFYLDELTGRREQVVETNLSDNIENMQVAIELMTEDDLSDVEHLQAYQARMKQLYRLEKFAFVTSDGLIYTSLGIQNNIDEYNFDYRNLTEPEVSVRGLDTDEKKVVIAVPLSGVSLGDERFVVCFTEQDMDVMTSGLSLQSDANETTFCNIYTRDGVSLTNQVLGGRANVSNLFEALELADFEEGYALDTIMADFSSGTSGIASFTYDGVDETIDYVPVTGTDWMLTYLIRESVIGDQIEGVTSDITSRSLIQTILTALVMFAVFAAMLIQTRRSARLTLEKETVEAEARVKQDEMQQRLSLQEQLLEQERQRAQQDSMITALASDYRSVYYVDLDSDDMVCYQSDPNIDGGLTSGEHASFAERMARYAEEFVQERYRDDFLAYVKPENIRKELEGEEIISFRYLAVHGGVESYEMLRMAGVRHAQDRGDHTVHAVGMGFADVDRETREQMAQSQALSDALAVAEDANKAKTAFLSNMSHEIRTPMNAIIGLDNIALADPTISDTTREQLEKIGGSARHLLGLINDILDVSRIESGRMTINNEAFSMSKLLEQVNTIISGQCNDKGLNYTCKVNGHIDDSYIGDDMKLRQTFINILGNSVKFTPEGGDVTFTVERIAQYEGHSTLRFTMSDTGIGMDKEFLPRLFDAFAQEDSSATNKYGSTGLGMAITKNIVELMNGSIEVESEKGKGTTFIVTVTLSDAESLPVDFSDDDIDPQDLSVLVIDDDPVACEHARLVLESVGIVCEIAESGKEAIEMVRLRHARRSPFNLILVDWKMPEMDGVETTREIRSIIGSESAIIILTAYNWDDVLEEAITAGVDSFIAKPLFANNVLEEFQATFRRKNVVSPDAVHRAELAGRRVLIAEDMEINAEILIEILKMRDIESEHAENGRIAVEMFSEHEPGYYDAILMDMRMPEMDGLTATTTIRALEREDAKVIPIIALTANAFDEDVQQSLQAGLNAHLSKPVDPDNLFDTLEIFIQD